jgi:hypothetical protein
LDDEYAVLGRRLVGRLARKRPSVSLDGITVDARMLPRELQRQAHRPGLIPFIPTRSE